MKLKDLLINLILLAITLFIVFLFAEIGFRIFYKPIGKFYQSDPYIGQIHVPNMSANNSGKEYSVEVKINQHGFVGKDYDYAKSDNTWRAIMLGDSIVEAMQVETDKSFTSLLEQELDMNLPEKVEVLNMGVANLGTIRAYNNLKYYGLKYNPDMAILAFCVGSDITDNYMEQEEVVVKNGEEKKNWKQHVKSIILNNFRLAKYVRDRSYTSIPLRKIFIMLGFLESEKQVANKSEDEGEINFKYHVYLNDDTEIYKKGWEKTKEYVKKIKNILDESRIDFLVVLVPTRDQIYQESWKKTLENFPDLKNIELDLNRPQHELGKYFDEVGIKYFDLSPDLKKIASSSRDRLYYNYDGHFSPYGHKKVGELIYNYLVEDYFQGTTTEYFYNN